MTARRKQKEVSEEPDDQAIIQEDIDQYLNQTRIRDRVMKEMIKKLEKSGNKNDPTEPKNRK